MRIKSRSLEYSVVTLLVLLTARVAWATWPQFGRAVCTATGGQQHSAITTDGADGAIVTWQDFRFAKINIFAQHVLASGELDPAWPLNGRVLLSDAAAMANADGGQTDPVIVSDGAGGAIVAWLDNRSPVTETDIFAQHILASGVVDANWKSNGTELCEIEGVQNTLVMVSDGEGGAIVTWMDGRPGATVKDIFAQHVLASGQVDLRWPEDGLAVSNAPGLQEFPSIIADGLGGAIITWDDSRTTTTGVEIYSQHVLSSGLLDRSFPVDGLAVCTAAGDQGRTTTTSDGAHGAIVAWSDSRIVGTAHIFAQHVLASGAVDPLWPANGRAVSDAGVSEGRPLAVSDGAGGAIVNWQAFTVHISMHAHHVTAAGVLDPVWPVGGRLLSHNDRQQTLAAIVSDGAGGAVVAWNDSADVVAMRVRASGATDPAFPRAVANLPREQGDVALVATSGGGAIVSWTDGRGVDTDIFALQILEATPTDVPAFTPAITFAPAFPNPANGSFTLRFVLPREAPVTLAIYDVAGRRVREVVTGRRSAGEHTFAWDTRDEHGNTVGAGVYFARLEADGFRGAQKLVRVR